MVYRKSPLQGRHVVIKVAWFCEFQGKIEGQSSFEERIVGMQREERLYERLVPIQGRFVPRFCGEALCFQGLATEYTGKSLDSVEVLSNRKVRTAPWRHSGAIHALGMLHGDTALRKYPDETFSAVITHRKQFGSNLGAANSGKIWMRSPGKIVARRR